MCNPDDDAATDPRARFRNDPVGSVQFRSNLVGTARFRDIEHAKPQPDEGAEPQSREARGSSAHARSDDIKYTSSSHHHSQPRPDTRSASWRHKLEGTPCAGKQASLVSQAKISFSLCLIPVITNPFMLVHYLVRAPWSSDHRIKSNLGQHVPFALPRALELTSRWRVRPLWGLHHRLNQGLSFGDQVT